jgi:hypothetical protein
MNFKLSPSDTSFLFDGCQRCFYLKVRHGIVQPSIPLPSIFSKIASLLKQYYDQKRTEQLHPALPPGTIILGEKWVQSKVISLPNHIDTCYIKGRFDVVVSFDDGTYGVIDYKTANPDSELFHLYGRQLQSYAYALENPAPGALALSPVTKLGLLYFHPTQVSQDRTDWLSFNSEIRLIEIEKNDEQFLAFIDEVLNLLKSSEPPAYNPGCNWCNYLSRAE